MARFPIGARLDLKFRAGAETLEPVSDFKVNRLNQRRRLVLFPLYLLMRVWMRTVRFRIAPEDWVRLGDVSRPTLLVCWHNSLFGALALYRQFRYPRPTHGLVSASKDGAWLAALLELLGMRPVRGSSSRGGREALNELTAKLRSGDDVAITPDGPRGPIYDFKPGAAILIRRSGAQVLLAGFEFGAAWRLKSWDRFVIPLPFSRVRLSTRLLSPGEVPTDLTTCAAELRKTLRELTAERAASNEKETER